MMTMDCRTTQVKMCFFIISIGNVHHYHHYHLLYFIEHGGDQLKHDDDEQHGQADDNKQCGDARQNTV